MRSSSYVSFLYTVLSFDDPLAKVKGPVFPFLANKLAYKKCLTTPFLQSEENERDWDEEVKKKKGKISLPLPSVQERTAKRDTITDNTED